MQMLASNVMCVGRNIQKWDNGDLSYRVQLSNGEGGVMVATCDEKTYNEIVPLKGGYDMVINVDTNGYKNYVDVLKIAAK